MFFQVSQGFLDGSDSILCRSYRISYRSCRMLYRPSRPLCLSYLGFAQLVEGFYKGLCREGCCNSFMRGW